MDNKALIAVLIAIAGFFSAILVKDLLEEKAAICELQKDIAVLKEARECK